MKSVEIWSMFWRWSWLVMYKFLYWELSILIWFTIDIKSRMFYDFCKVDRKVVICSRRCYLRPVYNSRRENEKYVVRSTRMSLTLIRPKWGKKNVFQKIAHSHYNWMVWESIDIVQKGMSCFQEGVAHSKSTIIPFISGI